MKKHIIHICTLFFTIGLLYSCNDAYIIDEQQATNTTENTETGIPLPEVLTFNLATDSTPDTRLAFTEDFSGGQTAITSVWSQGDSFIVLGNKINENNQIVVDDTKQCVYTLIDGANTPKGTFQANGPTFSAEYYSMYYPSSVKSWGDFCRRPLTGQIQQGNGSTSHLKDYYSFAYQRFSDPNSLTFKPSRYYNQTGCMKFNLSGFPSSITPTAIELSVVDNDGAIIPGKFYKFVGMRNGSEESTILTLEGFGATSSITAYMVMAQSDIELETDHNLRVTVHREEGLPIYADKPAGGKTIKGGLLNTITVTSGWKETYTSTDFSEDFSYKQTVYTIQKASSGYGIDIYLMGDGFSDRQIADGTYATYMKSTADCLFQEEPYKSFQDCFNIYYVNAVSKNEGYVEGGSTAFSGKYGEGTHVEGDNNKCQDYAKIIYQLVHNKEMSNEDWNNTTIIVPMNSKKHAGTCYMGSSISNSTQSATYGVGYSISYFPIGQNAEHLSQLVLHETGGHGIGKLLDEYFYTGTISQKDIETNLDYRKRFGWGWNVDYTSEPNQVVWAKFLTDNRFSGQGLGVYKGAATYQYGAYRPTDNSIMNDNTGGYNAPSREAIYYRIQKLAYGKEPNYEDFVAWDQDHRSSFSITRAYKKIYPPTAPPVIINLP